jgi:hypothetical protein
LLFSAQRNFHKAKGKALASLTALHDKMQDDVQVTRIEGNYQEILKTYTMVESEVDAFALRISKAGMPFHVATHYDKVTLLCAQIESVCDDVTRYTDSWTRRAGKVSGDATAAKETWRRARNYIKEDMCQFSKKTPPLLAKCAADALHARIVDPSTIGLALSTNTPEIFEDETYDEAFFRAPRLIVKQADDDTVPSYMTTNLAKYWSFYQAELMAKRDRVNSKRVETENGFVFSYCDVSVALPWHASGQGLENATSVNPVMYLQRPYYVDARDCSIVLKGIRTIVQCVAGTIVVLVVPPHLGLHHADLPLFLKNIVLKDEKSYKGVFSFMLDPGMACYTPFGFVGITMAVVPKRHIKGKKASKQEMEEPACFLAHYCYGPHEQQAGISLQHMVAAWFNANKAYFPSAIANDEGFKAFVVKLAAAKEVEEDTPVVVEDAAPAEVAQDGFVGCPAV